MSSHEQPKPVTNDTPTSTSKPKSAKKSVQFTDDTTDSSATQSNATVSNNNTNATLQSSINDAASKLKPDDMMKLLRQLGITQPQTQPLNKSQLREYKFWSTQPVLQFNNNTTTGITSSSSEFGAIESKQVSDINPDSYPLPSGFYWVSIDMSIHNEINEVYELLCGNYVEDDDNMFRFDYSRDFLQWALRPPGYNKDWHIGIRHRQTNKLYAFISGIPANINIYNTTRKMVEINFLCVHKKLRSKRLAPVLIKEITRRVNLCDIWQAVYTAGVLLPKPVAVNRYYHRSLNPKKLIEIGFSRLGPNMTMARTIKLYKLPSTTSIPGIRPLRTSDVPAACTLLNNHLKQYKLVQQFDEAEFLHWFVPRGGVISCYVVENPSTGEITDLTSYYTLPSTVIGNDKHKLLKAAYSFYHVATSVESTALINDALILAANDGFDVFNALNLMNNDQFLKSLKFGIGDGELHYYLYNWKCPQINPEQVGLVLL